MVTCTCGISPDWACVNELQYVAGAYGFPGLRVADVDGVGGDESVPELIGTVDPVEPALPPADQSLLVGGCEFDVKSVHLDVGVLEVGELPEDSRTLTIPGKRALNDDIFLASDAHSSNLVRQLHRFQVHERGEFARCQCVSVSEDLGQLMVV